MGANRKGRLIGCSLLVVLLCILLAACTGKTNDAPSTSANGSAQPADSSPKKPAAKIHILTSHVDATYAKQAKPADDPYIKELSRLSGYDLTFEFLGHADDYVQQLTVRFASNDLPDLIRTDGVDSTIHPGAVDQGVFKELGPLIDKFGPNIKKRVPESAWKDPLVSKNGKIYGIPAMPVAPATRTVYIRQDWLDALGMKQPVTLEDYLAFFEAVKNRDMNGNGVKDEYGFYGRENLRYSDIFFQDFGVHPQVWHMQNGKMIPDMIRPEMKDAIAFYKMLYDKGYMNPNVFTNKIADWQAGIFKGLGGLWAHEATDLPTVWAKSNFVNQPNLKIVPIAPPKGPKGQGMNPERSNVAFVWVIPEKNKQPEDIVKFLDWAYSDAANEFFAFGIEGKNYTKTNGTVKWDLNAPENATLVVSDFYQLSLNVRGDGRMVPDVVKLMPDAELLTKGFQIAADAVIKHDDLYMPPLRAFDTHPELVPGINAGGLFLDMFAKVVTGKEELNAAFDAFTAEWKKRGGDAAIEEATAWYNKFNKK
ncbi:extracellular solute-binding protein [Paenibacillus cymbidii]|uniref:extracellular solute-binding protein n=1 Tax=Paenibacillus cymbidii TaxID=1639034 RepID=UPI00108146BC|nr:extracellular solute-binding protein [Paenibacillus cymbidii]